MEHRAEKIRYVNFILIMAAILVNIKSIFCDFGLDNAYALATSWRNIQGDNLFGTMWEPHMTSSFLLTFFMRLFFMFSDGVEGISVFCQLMGIAWYGAVAAILFFGLRKITSKQVAFYIMIFFMVARAKNTVFPEYSNMIVTFSVLSWMLLTEYLETEENRILLVLASLASACLVLSYPTTLLVFISVMASGLYFARKKKQFIIGYTVPCIMSGMAYFAYLCAMNGFQALYRNIFYVFGSDEAHPRGFFNMGSLWEWDLAYGVYVIYPVLLILTLVLYRKLSIKTKRLCAIGWGIAISTFLSVIMVTNLTLNSAFSYMILGVIVSFVALGEITDHEKIIHVLIVSAVCIVIANRGLVVVGFPQTEAPVVFNCENYIRKGPNKGIVTTIQNCSRSKSYYEEWQTYILPEDRVLAVGGWYIDSSVYLNTNAETAHFSVMCNPTYNEKLEEYWEFYPEKKPTVIAVSGYGGKYDISNDSWILKYMEGNYTIDTVGEYWTFYRINEK